MSAFVIIGSRICNLDSIDDISYEVTRGKKISIPPPDKEYTISWDVIILYKSGNAISENVVKGEYTTDEEYMVFHNQFEELWISLLSFFTAADEEGVVEVKDKEEEA